MNGANLLRRQALRRSRLFAHLSDGDIDAMLAHASGRRYAEGERIFAKGDPGSSMMAVLKGRVTISTPSPDGHQVILTVIREGDVFGEIAMLDGKERSADATAASECELLVVARRALLSLLERRPELCLDLLVVLCEKLRRTNEQVEDLAFLDLAGRMAKALLRLAEETGAGAGAGVGRASDRMIGVRISQRALSEIVSSSRESVNKHLQDWKRSGIISIEKGAIVILDPKALAALG